ncbi:MAG: IS1634 family transposase, partial [bacterium]|nr:IS1634 family transposase [bacterium]
MQTLVVDPPVVFLNTASMFLRAHKRIKDGKEHRYWSIVENRRVQGNRVVQRQVLYLGEINDSQRTAWCRTIDVFDEDQDKSTQLAIFPEDRQAPELACEVVQIRLSDLQLHRPRQWGACWLACQLWDQLALDDYWETKLRPSRQGTRWLNVFKTLVCYHLINPGSEWRLHRHWYDHSAMGDLLGEDFALVQSDKLYRCLDKLLPHKAGLFSFLRQRWQALFDAHFEVLLYDLTSTYFECEPPAGGKRKFGYSRDKRSDCVQVVIALIVTPQGFPIAYEVMPGNTSDKTTLREFLQKIEAQYGRADRTWVMDRGIPTEEVLQEMRSAEQPIHYLVGTPKGRLSKMEKAFLSRPWEQVREGVDVKLLEKEGEVYVLAKSVGRVDKERSMRRRRLKKLWNRLHELQQQKLTRDQLLIKLGAAKKEAGRAYHLVEIQLPEKDQDVTAQTFTFSLKRKKLRMVRRREGRYLLRSNLVAEDPAKLWRHYIQLTEIEQAFKELKSDLSIRPIYHQLDHRIEAHIFVAFQAYCLQVTLKQRLRALAPGLTPKAVLEKFSTLQMVDVHLPTTDGRYLVLPRHTQPNKDQQILLSQLKLSLPDQPPPRIYSKTSHAT